MRHLMWVSMGFAAGCGVCAYELAPIWRILLLVFCVVGAGSLLFMGKEKLLRRVGLVCLGCAVGLGWFQLYQSLYLNAAVRIDGQEAQALVTASDYSYETDYGIAVDGSVMLEEKRYRIRLYLDGQTELSPGDTVTGCFRFRLTAPGGREEATYHGGMGIFLLGYQTDTVEIHRAGEISAEYFGAVWARRITRILDRCFSGNTASFAKALLLGDTTGLSYETDTWLKLSGIRHVAAVSGLHVSILVVLVSMLTFRRRFLMPLVGIPMLFLFAAVAGFTPSVVRSCIMSALMLLAVLFDREYDGPTALSFAALVMLLVNPLAITSVSFQLSAASVAGIFCFQDGIRTWILSRLEKHGKNRMASRFASSVAISLSAQVFTTPLCAYYFGTVSLIGVVTNLLTLWIISGLFYGLMAVCLVSLLWESRAALLAAVLALPIRFVLTTAEFLGGLPFAAVYLSSGYIAAWLVLCYVLLGVFLVQKVRKPVLLSCCASLGLCLALLASWVQPLTADTRLTVLDVGQGQSLLLQSGGHTFLIDCGGDSETGTADIIAQTLLGQGITRLDGILLTHFDDDHTAALADLLTRIDTRLLLFPDNGAAMPDWETEGACIRVSEDLELMLETGKLTVFGPILPGSGNENSLCVLFESENCDILVTGDRSGFGERMLLRHADIPDVDVLVAGHHGAADSTCAELLEAVRPETVLISVGEDNPYGHPSPILLERLETYGCTVYRTDRDGTIVYTE